MKKILVTGSSGQVGSYLADFFLCDYDVIGLDIKKSSIESVARITKIGDVKDREFVCDIVKDVDVIIHTAAQLNNEKSIEDPVFDAELNIIGTLNLLDAARENKKISKFLYFSTAAVYGNSRYLPVDEKHPLSPISPYGLSKMVGEKYCLMYYKLFDLPVVILRPFNMYSEREDMSKNFISVVNRFVNDIKKEGRITIYGDGSQKRDLIHVEDVIRFVDILISNDNTNGEIFNIGYGKPISILDLARLIIKVFDKKEDDCLKFERFEDKKIDDSYADISKAKKFGFLPRNSIEEGIKKIIDD